jgi:hypothetical protein
MRYFLTKWFIAKTPLVALVIETPKEKTLEHQPQGFFYTNRLLLIGCATKAQYRI